MKMEFQDSGMPGRNETLFQSAKTLGETIGSLSEEAANSFKDSVDTHRKAGVEAIASVARSAREAADGFEDQSPHVARFVRSAAAMIERVSNDAGSQNLADLTQSILNFARRQPRLFVCCGIVVGFLAFRLLRDNADHHG